MKIDEIKKIAAPVFWGAAVGAIALAVTGFNWGGWVSSDTAEEMAQTAVVNSLIPICVGQFNADPNKAMKLIQIKKIESWNRAEFVTKQGWATMPGATEASNSIASKCADKIMG